RSASYTLWFDSDLEMMRRGGPRKIEAGHLMRIRQLVERNVDRRKQLQRQRRILELSLVKPGLPPPDPSILEELTTGTVSKSKNLYNKNSGAALTGGYQQQGGFGSSKNDSRFGGKGENNIAQCGGDDFSSLTHSPGTSGGHKGGYKGAARPHSTTMYKGGYHGIGKGKGDEIDYYEDGSGGYVVHSVYYKKGGINKNYQGNQRW
ncbi:unnamed protein product, partial [Amoebophrya sp. A25]